MNYYSDSKLLCRSIFSTAVSFGYFRTIIFGHCNVKITSQKLSWNYFLGAVILIGDLSASRNVISGKLGLGEKFSGAVT